MVKHIKPTEAEIKAQLESTIKELDATPAEPTGEEVIEKPATEVVVEKKDEAPVVVEKKEEATPPVTPPTEPKPKEDVDFKKKFTHSTRENQVLTSQVRKLTDAITSASAIPDPTEEEMTAIYSDWEIMDETTKILAKDNVKNKRVISQLSNISQESKDIEAWNQKVDAFVEDPKTLIDTPELEGRTEEFKVFSTKPTRRGLDFPDLVSAFLFEASKEVKVNKGKMFEQGTGGSNQIARPHSDKITIEQAMALKDKDYKKYKEYLLAGRIEQNLD